jgi:hypothetical protein
MNRQEISFTDYMDNSKQLFKMLFGEEMYNQLNSIPLKEIEWEGLDIKTSKILATFPSVKERFTKDWIEYFGERDYTMLDLYLQVVFHYGYQQSVDNHYDVEKTNKLMEEIKKSIEENKNNLQK